MNCHYYKLEVTWFPVWFEFYITLNSISCIETWMYSTWKWGEKRFGFLCPLRTLSYYSLHCSHIMWVERGWQLTQREDFSVTCNLISMPTPFLTWFPLAEARVKVERSMSWLPVNDFWWVVIFFLHNNHFLCWGEQTFTNDCGLGK